LEPITRKKIRKAKLIGSGYFILLALINLIGSAAYNYFDWSSPIILTITCLPLLINKRQVYLLFGIFYSLIMAYLGLAILIEGIAGLLPLIMISLITLLGILCSALMAYSGIVISEKRFSLI